jgi:hypothetical protein
MDDGRPGLAMIYLTSNILNNRELTTSVTVNVPSHSHPRTIATSSFKHSFLLWYAGNIPRKNPTLTLHMP